MPFPEHKIYEKLPSTASLMLPTFQCYLSWRDYSNERRYHEWFYCSQKLKYPIDRFSEDQNGINLFYVDENGTGQIRSVNPAMRLAEFTNYAKFREENKVVSR